MQLTAEKAAYIEEKLKQFKLVDMRQQYSDIIREAESSSMDYLELSNSATTNLLLLSISP